MLSGVGRGRSNQAERYWSLVSQAERIRLSLLIVTRLRVRLGREPGTEHHTGYIDRARDLAARILKEVGNELLAGGSSGIDPGSMQQLSQLTDAYRVAEDQSRSSAVEALVGQTLTALTSRSGRVLDWISLLIGNVPGHQVAEALEAELHERGSWAAVADAMGLVLEEIGRGWARRDGSAPDTRRGPAPSTAGN
jgi:hypothetical protein